MRSIASASTTNTAKQSHADHPTATRCSLNPKLKSRTEMSSAAASSSVQRMTGGSEMAIRWLSDRYQVAVG